jgi:hypothetical protein
MLHLVVLGATGLKCPAPITEKITEALKRWGDRVHYADTREAAFDLIEKQHPDAVLAYAPGVFGDAAVGGKVSPRINLTEPQVIITVGGDPAKWHETDDPRQFLEAAWNVLPVRVALNVAVDTHLDILDAFLRINEEVAF